MFGQGQWIDTPWMEMQDANKNPTRVGFCFFSFALIYSASLNSSEYPITIISKIVI
jgi:hypothetical protein